MNTKDDAVTNWHNYKPLDKCLTDLDVVITGLEKIQPEIKGEFGTNLGTNLITQLNQAKRELWVLRRYCDEHAG